MYYRSLPLYIDMNESQQSLEFPLFHDSASAVRHSGAELHALTFPFFVNFIKLPFLIESDHPSFPGKWNLNSNEKLIGFESNWIVQTFTWLFRVCIYKPEHNFRMKYLSSLVGTITVFKSVYCNNCKSWTMTNVGQSKFYSYFNYKGFILLNYEFIIENHNRRAFKYPITVCWYLHNGSCWNFHNFSYILHTIHSNKRKIQNL